MKKEVVMATENLLADLVARDDSISNGIHSLDMVPFAPFGLELDPVSTE